MYFWLTEHKRPPPQMMEVLSYLQTGSRTAHASLRPIPSVGTQHTGETAPRGERCFGGK